MNILDLRQIIKYENVKFIEGKLSEINLNQTAGLHNLISSHLL